MARVGGEPVAQVDHRAGARAARARRRRPAAARAAGGARPGRRPRARGGAPFEQRAGPAAEPPSSPVTHDLVARPRAVAADERVRVVGPAGHADRDGQAVRRDHVAARDRDARPRAASSSMPATSARAASGVEPARQRERDVRLARLGSHRRQVGEGGGERLVADVGGRVRVEREVRAVGHGVDRHDREPARANDRRVVAGAAHEPLAARLEQLLERRDQVELAHGYSLNGCPR